MHPETPIDLKKTHFSRAGSYFVFTLSEKEDAVLLQSVRNGIGDKPLGRFFPTDKNKNPLPFEVNLVPSKLSLNTADGGIDICIASPKIIRIQISGSIELGIEFDIESDNILQLSKGWRLAGWDQPVKLMLSLLDGSFKAIEEQQKDSPLRFQLSSDQENGAIAIEEFETEWEARRYLDDFENCVARVSNEFEQYLLTIPNPKPEYSQAKELAAYITWSNILGKSGHVLRKAITRSKGTGGMVRTRDSAFAALASAPGNITLAWDYFMSCFDQQSENGQIPSSITDKQISYNITRPPMHGWILRWIINHGESVTSAMMQEVYEKLVSATEWWFRFREDSTTHLPCYYSSAESGWHGSSAMANSMPVHSPDLLVFLIHQMDTLCLLASRLGKPGEANAWRNRSLDLTKKLLDKFWDGNKFVTRGADGEVIRNDSQSLQSYIPIILGNKLPIEISNKMAEDLSKEDFILNNFGLSTESQTSKHYKEDSEWCGAVIAPPILLIVDGLRQTKNAKLAREIAKRFCNLCLQSGFASHFNAKTGEPYGKSSFTWTATIFQILAAYYG